MRGFCYWPHPAVWGNLRGVKIAIFLPNWLGDVVMSTPALRAIRRLFGVRGRIVGIARPQMADLLAGTLFLDEIRPFDPKSSDRQQRRWALLRWMRGEKFDMAVLLTHSFHTALLAWLGGADQRIGYARDGRGVLLNQKLHPNRLEGKIAPEPVVDTYLAIAEAMGCPPESPQLELAVTAEEARRGDEAWNALGLREGRVIGLNSGAAYGAAKLWPVEHFAALGRMLAAETDHDVLVVCGPNERDMARQIAHQADHPRVVSLADQPVGIGLTKACLGRCRLTVSTDSGPRHIAAALGRPVITLLGPTMPIWIENPLVRGVDLQLALDCIGCYRRTCPLKHHRCMRDLSPETVFAAAARLLKDEGAAAA